MHCVLSGSGANFQHTPAIDEVALEYFEDRAAVTITGFGVWFFVAHAQYYAHSAASSRDLLAHAG